MPLHLFDGLDGGHDSPEAGCDNVAAEEQQFNAMQAHQDHGVQVMGLQLQPHVVQRQGSKADDAEDKNRRDDMPCKGGQDFEMMKLLHRRSPCVVEQRQTPTGQADAPGG